MNIILSNNKLTLIILKKNSITMKDIKQILFLKLNFILFFFLTIYQIKNYYTFNSINFFTK